MASLEKIRDRGAPRRPDTPVGSRGRAGPRGDSIVVIDADRRAHDLRPLSGWRKLEGRWAYLHGGGALGASLTVAGVETPLPAALAPFILPAPPTGAELRSAIRASLAVLDLAPDRVTVPTLGAVWRSILGAVDFSVFVYGATGRFKTALAALLQQR